jgi:hypothetical protein
VYNSLGRQQGAVGERRGAPAHSPAAAAGRTAASAEESLPPGGPPQERGGAVGRMRDWRMRRAAKRGQRRHAETRVGLCAGRGVGCGGWPVLGVAGGGRSRGIAGWPEREPEGGRHACGRGAADASQRGGQPVAAAAAAAGGGRRGPLRGAHTGGSSALRGAGRAARAPAPHPTWPGARGARRGLGDAGGWLVEKVNSAK